MIPKMIKLKTGEVALTRQLMIKNIIFVISSILEFLSIYRYREIKKYTNIIE